jgi:hypothetical protein
MQQGCWNLKLKSDGRYLLEMNQINQKFFIPVWSLDDELKLELVSKELNHLAAILHVYDGGLNFMK